MVAVPEVQKYRKKPVVIEAAQLSGGNGRCMEVAYWMVDSGYPWLVGDALKPETLRYKDNGEIPVDKGIWIAPADGSLMIRTLEGDMKADLGDFIIKGVKGEFYPCKPDIFAATYEAV